MITQCNTHLTTHGASSQTTALMLIQIDTTPIHMTTHSHSGQKSTMTPLAISLEQVAFMGRRKNLVEPTQKKQTQMLNITPFTSLTSRYVARSKSLIRTWFLPSVVPSDLIPKPRPRGEGKGGDKK